MPELPEVETYVRHFRPLLEGRRIVRFDASWPRQIEPDVATVRRWIAGRRIARLERRAKYIVAELTNGETAPCASIAPGRAPSAAVSPNRAAGAGFLMIHLRMTGRLEWSGNRAARPEHVRAAFRLDDGHTLWFCDARKFGRIAYTSDLARATAHLGVEPLGGAFTAKVFEELLRCRARRLKPLLLDQSIVAGLGNIYVDEALFRAGLHPLTVADALTAEQVRRLRRAIRAVLRQAIRLGGTSFDWVYPEGGMKRHLYVYGRAGEPCKRCATPIAGLRVGQRGTHVCPRCQPAPGQPR